MDICLIPLPQELRNQITCLSSVLSAFWGTECCMHLGHAVVGPWQAVSGGSMYGGRVHPAHRSDLFDEQWPWGVLFRTITNVLDMLIENRELININVHNFSFLTWLENPLQAFVDSPASWIFLLDGTSIMMVYPQPYGKSTHTIKSSDMDNPFYGNFHG